MTARHTQSGFALVELLAVMTISLIMLSAVLLAFEGFQTRAERNARLNEGQAQTRQVVGQLARDLRNLASPTPQQPQAIDSAAPYDLVFQTVNPNAETSSNITNVQRVRYCLDQPTVGDSTLWAQTQTWTTPTIPSMPSTSGCPAASGSGWGPARRVVGGVTNRAANRPLFLYNATIKTDITAVTVQLWSRSGGDREPRVGTLRTQVFLRNQNQAPLAAFRPSPSSGRILLNGSGSADPEGDELRYDWYLDQAPDCRAGTAPTPRGSGIVYEMANVPAGQRTVTLIVYDSAGLCSRSTQTVTVPS